MHHSRANFYSYSEQEFLISGQDIFDAARNRRSTIAVAVGRYISHFGITPIVTSAVWEQVFVERPSEISTSLCMKPHHLLWALLFMKQYSTEHVIASMIGVDEKTARLYIWEILEIIRASRSEFVSSYDFCL